MNAYVTRVKRFHPSRRDHKPRIPFYHHSFLYPHHTHLADRCSVSIGSLKINGGKFEGGGGVHSGEPYRFL